MYHLFIDGVEKDPPFHSREDAILAKDQYAATAKEWAIIQD